MYWLKLTNLSLLLGATAWLAKAPDWEPFLAFIGFLTTFLAQDIRDFRKVTSGNNKINNDKQNFEKYESILPGNELLYVFNNELFNLRTDMSFVKKLGAYLRRSEEIEGQFNDKKIQKEFSKAVKILSKLKIFLATHFFVPREGKSENIEGEFLLYLYPDLKYSGDPKKINIYKQREQELHKIVDEAIEFYKNYRKSIKRKMYI
jgi:hypothetical protein